MRLHHRAVSAQLLSIIIDYLFFQVYAPLPPPDWDYGFPEMAPPPGIPGAPGAPAGPAGPVGQPGQAGQPGAPAPDFDDENRVDSSVNEPELVEVAQVRDTFEETWIFSEISAGYIFSGLPL